MVRIRTTAFIIIIAVAVCVIAVNTRSVKDSKLGYSKNTGFTFSELSIRNARPVFHQKTMETMEGKKSIQSLLINENPSKEEALLADNREKLLSMLKGSDSFLNKLELVETPIALIRQELLQRLGVLYRDALVAQIVHGGLDDTKNENLWLELEATQISMDPAMIPEPLPEAEKHYGEYLRQLITTISANKDTVGISQLANYAYKVQDLLQRRKRHSDNLYLMSVRSTVSNSEIPVLIRVGYVESLVEAEDYVLARYGADILSDVLQQESLTDQEKAAIKRLNKQLDKDKAND